MVDPACLSFHAASVRAVCFVWHARSHWRGFVKRRPNNFRAIFRVILFEFFAETKR